MKNADVHVKENNKRKKELLPMKEWLMESTLLGLQFVMLLWSDIMLRVRVSKYASNDVM